MNNPADNARSTVFQSASAITVLRARKHSRELPAEPVVRIRPPVFGEKPDFAELWAHREVLYFLMWRDLKVRYKQTALGAAWVILQAVLITIIFTMFLGKLIRVPSDGVPYPIFAYASLLLWTFESNAILSSAYSLVTHAHILTRTYFSRLLIPIATIGVRVVDLLIGSLVLIVLMVYYHVPIGWHVLMFPLFVLQITALTLAIGILTAALN